MRNSKRISVTAVFVVAFMMVFALSNSMYGILLPYMIEHYGLSLTHASLFDAAGEIGQISAMLLAMFFLDRTDKNAAIVAMVFLYGITMLALGFAPVFFIALPLRAVWGISGSLVDNLCGTYMADLYGERRTRYVSILYTFFAVGSVLGPPVASLFLSGFRWNSTYMAVGAIIVAVATAFIAAMGIVKKPTPAIGHSPTGGGRKSIPLKRIFSNHNLRWLSLGNVLLAGVMYINVWTPTYLQTTHPDAFDMKLCSIILTLSYIGMIVSRSLFGILSPKLSAIRYLRWSCILTSAVIVFMIVMPGKWVWLSGMLLFGIFSGSQYTAKYLLAFSEFPEYTATVASINAIFTALGTISIKVIINHFADRGFYRSAMIIPAAMLFFAYFVFRYGFHEKSEAFPAN